MLFMLGRVIEKSNKRFSTSPVEVRLSKIDFIKAMMKIKAVSKKERAMYKNLEALEKQKLISYRNREMKITKKGMRKYQVLDKRIRPYLETQSIINNTKIPVKKTKLRI